MLRLRDCHLRLVHPMCLLLLVLVVAPIGQAQDPTDAPAAPIVERPLRIELSVPSQEISPYEGFDVDITITNSSAINIDIDKVTLTVPEILRRFRRPAPNSATGDIVVDWPIKTLTQGSYTHTQSINVTDSLAWNVLLANLTMQPGDFPIKCRVLYAPSTPDMSGGFSYQEEGRGIVHVKSPLAYMLIGSFVGALLLGLFVPIYRLPKRSRSERTARKLFTSFLTYTLSGWVVSACFILLMLRFKDTSLPVVIETRDFFGGVVVGLFSYKIGDWLHGVLFKPEPDT